MPDSHTLDQLPSIDDIAAMAERALAEIPEELRIHLDGTIIVEEAVPGSAQDLAARVAELEAELARLRADARRHAEEKRMLASETLPLVHRARTAEDRLAACDLVANRHKQAAPSQSDISAMVRT